MPPLLGLWDARHGGFPWLRRQARSWDLFRGVLRARCCWLEAQRSSAERGPNTWRSSRARNAAKSRSRFRARALCRSCLEQRVHLDQHPASSSGSMPRRKVRTSPRCLRGRWELRPAAHKASVKQEPQPLQQSEAPAQPLGFPTSPKSLTPPASISFLQQTPPKVLKTNQTLAQLPPLPSPRRGPGEQVWARPLPRGVVKQQLCNSNSLSAWVVRAAPVPTPAASPWETMVTLILARLEGLVQGVGLGV